MQPHTRNDYPILIPNPAPFMRTDPGVATTTRQQSKENLDEIDRN